MHLHRFPPCLMQPGNDDDVVAGTEPIQALCRELRYLKPSVERAFRALQGGFTALLDSGADHTDRAKLRTAANLSWFPHCSSPKNKCPGACAPVLAGLD